MVQMIITAVGPDRPGIVGELTGFVHSAGGNLLDSRMVNLRGEFAMMILLESPQDAAKKLEHDIAALGQGIGLTITARRQERRGESVKGLPFRLKTYSMDQPGIVARITSVLRSHSVNIEELEARQESAAFAGSPLFVTEMRLTVPPQVPLGKLRRELEEVGNAINCDVDLDPDE
ncbi:MAG TPA: ACT domain-containing protein [Tepidisphaeraceae bacterium]|jgi:glycine cleavage system transcriptional repressor